MPSPQWKFREKQHNEIHQNPVITEFFRNKTLQIGSFAKLGKNAMDAADDGTARLVFSFVTLPAAMWDRYFAGLWPHLQAQKQLRDSLPSTGEPIPCLLVEDFGTTGLTGPLVPDDPHAAEQDERGHRLFWFSETRHTSKRPDQLGSFGIGKTVFPYSSRINSFFGYSVRNSTGGEPRVVMLGQSQLREHRLPGTGDLDPFGFFAHNEGPNNDYIHRTISEADLLDEFRASFSLRRKDQAGLSVVIPYPEESLSRADLAREAIRQFFVPILSGELTVEIHEGDESVSLAADSVLEAISKISWGGQDPERLRRHVQLATWRLKTAKVISSKPRSPRARVSPNLRRTCWIEPCGRS